MSKSGEIPSWWITMTGFSAKQGLALLRETKRLGISKNDRNAVTRVWRNMCIARALNELGHSCKETDAPT